MVFRDGPLGYEEKRRFRYGLQDYMLQFYGFEKLRGKRVLELGSGSGIDTCEMIRNGAEVVSLDFSPLGCTATNALLKEAKLDGNVVMADASCLPLRNEQFDVVYSFGVIHHIADVQNVLTELTRCLRRSGEFMGMVYNRDSLLYAYSLLYLHGIKDGLLSKGIPEEEIVSRFSERVEGNPYTRCYSKADSSRLPTYAYSTMSLILWRNAKSNFSLTVWARTWVGIWHSKLPRETIEAYCKATAHKADASGKVCDRTPPRA
jgi:ubiquinone/menaquinone biosynthesis C-methylase UbiE